MTRQLLIALVASCISAGAAGAPAAPTASATPAVHRIIISKMAFGTAPPGIRAGDIIEWVNEDIFLHSVTADDKSFDADVAPDKSVRTTLRQPGIIAYFCKYHPSMRARLTVER